MSFSWSSPQAIVQCLCSQSDPPSFCIHQEDHRVLFSTWFSRSIGFPRIASWSNFVVRPWKYSLIDLFPLLQLSIFLSHLLDMAFCMFGVGWWEGCPDLSWCRRRREDGLDRGGYGAKKSVVNQFVLAFPQVERRIRKHTCVSGDGWRRNNCRSINVAGEIITFKQSMNLIDGSTWWN